MATPGVNPLWRKVVRDLTRRRARTLLTLLGIVIGVAGLVATSATARQLGVAQRTFAVAPGSADLSVRTEPFGAHMISSIGRQLGAEAVEARTIADASFSAGGPWRESLIVGLPGTGQAELAPPRLVRGRFPNSGEVAFDVGVSALADVALGDLIAFRVAAGAPITYLTVVGFTRTPAAVDAGILNRATAYATRDDVDALREKDGANSILVGLSGGADLDAAAVEMDRLLDLRGVEHGPVIGADAGLVGGRELRTLVWLLLAFSVIGLVLSAFLVANTVAAVVHDEAGQIAVLKALGGRRTRIAGVYLAPALLLGGVGTVVAYGLGLGGAQLIVGYLVGLIGYQRPPLAVTAREGALATAVGVGVPVLAALGPALLAARRPVASLMRTYGLASATARGGGSSLRAVGERLPLAAMALRNAARRRLRAAVTVALIAVATAAAVAAQALSSSLDGTVESLYDRYGADAWIAFDVAADAALARIVAAEPGVAEAEGWARATGYTDGQSVDLWGLPPATTVYDHRVVAGRWLSHGSVAAGREAVLSARLARRLGLGPGDGMALDVANDTRDLLVVGIADDESTYLGSTAAGKLFLAPATLTSFGGAPGFSFMAVRFDRHDPAGVEERLAALEERLAPLRPRPYAAYSDKASTTRTIAVLTLLLRAMVALIGSIGLIGVVNTLAMSVAERRREVGVARALGARCGHLAALLATEGMALGVAGYACGLALGYPLGWLLVDLTGRLLFRLSFSLPPSFLGLTLLATVAGCGLASVGPALAAARVRPADVLRYE